MFGWMLNTLVAPVWLWVCFGAWAFVRTIILVFDINNMMDAWNERND